MSATLGALLTILEPTWRIGIYERLDEVALESSNPWNNAGTGHSALCELNYTPERKDGSVDISKAVTINEQFHTSREFWNHLLTAGLMEGTDFINVTPHMTFVRGADNVDFLRRRYEALSVAPAVQRHGVQLRPRRHRPVGSADDPGPRRRRADRRDPRRQRAPTSTSARSPRSSSTSPPRTTPSCT